MATRSSWKGCLQLSLVCVPVKAYSTASPGGGDIHLNQLHAACHRRIQYKKTCPLHGEVSNGQIVSGYEYAQDHYVVVDPDELDRLRTEADKAIKIDVFIAADAFDPLYGTGKRYYLAPDGPAGQKAYALLYQAMVEEDRYALAQVVLHGREQLVLLRPQENLLILEVLYTRKLQQLIEAKLAGKEIVAAPASEGPQVINLMEALKQSVARVQETNSTKKEPRKTARRMVRKIS